MRQLLPGQPGDRPEWEISIEGTDIGWIVQWQGTTRRTVFSWATALHPATGQRVCLESSPDFDGRVRVIEGFHLDPATGRAHYREVT